MKSENYPDELDAQGVLKNGYDKELDVWVIEYVVQYCGCPRPRLGQADCDHNAREYCGCMIGQAREREGLPAKDPRAPSDFITFINKCAQDIRFCVGRDNNKTGR